jgi:hypothetical protein
MEFEPDAMVAQIAMEYGADMVDLARSEAGVELDFSVDSVRDVEAIAGRLAAAKPRFGLRARDAEAKREEQARTIGFYVAETLRLSWGGDHGWVSDGEGSRVYGLRLPDETLCTPVARARDRLTSGADADLVAYVAGLRGS